MPRKVYTFSSFAPSIGRRRGVPLVAENQPIVSENFLAFVKGNSFLFDIDRCDFLLIKRQYLHTG